MSEASLVTVSGVLVLVVEPGLLVSEPGVYRGSWVTRCYSALRWNSSSKASGEREREIHRKQEREGGEMHTCCVTYL